MLIAALGIVTLLLVLWIVYLEGDRDKWRDAHQELLRRVEQRATDLEGLANLRPLGNVHRLPQPKEELRKPLPTENPAGSPAISGEYSTVDSEAASVLRARNEAET